MKLVKIAAALAAAFAAHAASAAVITVTVDDFSTATTAGAVTSTGTSTWASGAPNNVFSVSNTLFGTGTVTLTYNPGLLALPTGATNAQIMYTVVANDKTNLTENASAVNTVTANGSASNYTVVPPAVETVAPYTAGANIVLTFTSTATRAWEIAIDDLKVTYECGAAVEPTTFSSIGAFNVSMARNQSSCVPVPVPGSLALLGLGGFAAAFAARRRQVK